MFVRMYSTAAAAEFIQTVVVEKVAYIDGYNI